MTEGDGGIFEDNSISLTLKESGVAKGKIVLFHQYFATVLYGILSNFSRILFVLNQYISSPRTDSD